MKKKRLIFLALVMMFLLTACQISTHDTSSDRNDSRMNSSVVSDRKHSSPESGEGQTTGTSMSVRRKCGTGIPGRCFCRTHMSLTRAGSGRS